MSVLLIQVDQMHAAAMSCLGSPNVRTPHLDRLAASGTLFTQATCQSPICMPSRTSMLSGQYPSTNRQFGFSGQSRRGTPWLPLTFQQAGHRTAAFGKFHVVNIPEDRWGFDVAAPSLSEDEDLARPIGDTYRAYCRQHDIAWRTDQMHGHPFDDADAMPVLPSSARPDMHLWEKMACRSDVPAEHSLETWTTDRCLQFLGEHTTNEPATPFFIWLTYDRPHFPTTLPEPWFSRIRPDDLVLPPLPTVDDMMSWPRSVFDLHVKHTSIHNLGERAFRFIVATYYTLIEWLDAEVGRVLRRLRDLGLDDQTTIVFCSDHGDQAGWMGHYDKAVRCVTDAITRVPLIVRPAPSLGRAPGGVRVDAPVELVDLFPTLCGLSGVEKPARLDGRDLSAALLDSQPLPHNRPVVCEEFNRRMIARDGWRMVYYLDNEVEHALYDLRNDPHCYRNVYGDSALRDRRITLKRDLLRFLFERLHGPATAGDRLTLRRSLDPADPHLPLLLRNYEGVHFHGAVAVIYHDQHFLLAPMFEDGGQDDRLRLFDGKGRYRKDNQALPPDPQRVEAMLDFGISDCMRHLTQNSPYEHRRVTRTPVTREEALTLAARLAESS